MPKHEKIDKKQLLERLKNDVIQLEQEIQKEESKPDLFVSDFVLPIELESIVGHLCLMNKRDYYVTITKHVHFNAGSVYMVVRDYSDENIMFEGVSQQNPYPGPCGIVYNGNMTNIQDEDIFIPIIGFKEIDIPPFFLALVEYSDKGYTISNQTICRKSGIEVEV
jgi:hypothetical protein